jgi:hypothetical protein
MGAEVGTCDQYLDSANPSYYKDIHPEPQMLYLEGGDPFDYGGGHTLDGVPISNHSSTGYSESWVLSRTITFDVYQGWVSLIDNPRVITLPYVGSFEITLNLPDPKSQTINQPQNSGFKLYGPGFSDEQMKILVEGLSRIKEDDCTSSMRRLRNTKSAKSSILSTSC